MNTNLRIGTLSLAVLLVGGGLAACTSQAVTTGTGGSGGSGTGGSTSSGGATGTGRRRRRLPREPGRAPVCPRRRAASSPTSLRAQRRRRAGDGPGPASGTIPHAVRRRVRVPQRRRDADANLSAHLAGDGQQLAHHRDRRRLLGVRLLLRDQRPDACNRIDATALQGDLVHHLRNSDGHPITVGVETLNDTISRPG